MNFAITKRSGSLESPLRSIRLGGSEGFLANYICGLTAEVMKVRWGLDGKQVAALASENVCDTLLFLNTGQAGICYLIQSLVGISGPDETELVLRMISVKCELKGETIVLEESGQGSTQAFCESLILTGGYDGGTWKWREPAMSIGAAIV